MSALGCVLGSRSAKLHVPAAQHMGPDSSAWGGDRSLGSAATDLASVAALADPAGAESAERPLHHEFVEDQSVPAETRMETHVTRRFGSNLSWHHHWLGRKSLVLESEHERSDSLA